MFSHVTVGTNDIARAVAFYDRVLGLLGISRAEFDEAHGHAGYFTAPDTTPNFWVLRPIDRQPASIGNGVTVAFEAPDRATVDRVHAEILGGARRRDTGRFDEFVPAGSAAGQRELPAG